jgi:chemotaxis protein MotB
MGLRKPPPPASPAKGPKGAPPPPPEAPKRRRVRKAKAIYVASDDGDGNWLVSYADLMTLLFGFFVMLSAFSTPNAQKFEEMRKKTSESVGGTYTSPNIELGREFRQVLKDSKLDGEVVVTEDLEGVKITSKGTLFFDSGSAILKEPAAQIMQKIAEIISKKAASYKILVEGHTDDAPISSPLFPSNWELSAARASSVVRLMEAQSIPRRNLRPIGLSDTEPVLPNRDDAGQPLIKNQAENRRIVIKVQKNLGRGSSK